MPSNADWPWRGDGTGADDSGPEGPLVVTVVVLWLCDTCDTAHHAPGTDRLCHCGGRLERWSEET